MLVADDSQKAIRETAGAQTLRRGLDVLRLLTSVGESGLRVSEIGRRLDLNKSTSARLTRTLLEERFVAYDALTRRYRLGPEAFAVGLAAEPSYSLQRLVAPYLRSLALETGDWVFFSVPSGYDMICLSRECGDIPLPKTALKVGDCQHFCGSASGVAVLASLSDSKIQDILIQSASVMARDLPQCTPDVIRSLVHETRHLGYSVIPGLIVQNYWAIAVALLNEHGRAEASISLVASAGRLSLARRSSLGARLVKMGAELMASFNSNKFGQPSG
jgi:DNA-binding IclR family transcriptional regulator